MSIKTKTELLTDLVNLVRSNGENGKTSAAEVRTLLTNFIDTLFSRAGTVNGNLPDANGNVTLEFSGVQAQSYTYTALAGLAATNSLEPGNFYIVEDFATIHQIPYTSPAVINTGVPEPLTVLAVSENAFSPLAYSSTYPNDILYYDFTSNVCEDGVTPRKGLITYRKDVKRNIETYYDWRNVKFRRWAVTAPDWDMATTYALNNTVEYNGALWLSLLDNNLNNAPATNNNWVKLINLSPDANHSLIRRYVATTTVNFKMANKPVNTDVNSFCDYWTFNCYTDISSSTATNSHNSNRIDNISIGRDATAWRFNNIIFIDSHLNAPNAAFSRNSFGTNNNNMIFGNYTHFNKFSNECHSIFTETIFAQNDLGTWFNSNICSIAFHDNICGGDTAFNIFSEGGGASDFGYRFNNNIFQGRFMNCSFEYRSEYNQFSALENCTFNQKLYANSFKQPQYRLTCGVPISSKVIVNSYADKVINHKTATNKLFYTEVDEANNTLALTEML